MKYSGTIKQFGEWLKKETKITNISYQKVPAKNAGDKSARIVFINTEKVSAKRDQRILILILRLSGSAEQWESILDLAQTIENNLFREREYDIDFGNVENPDGSDVAGGDFILDIPIQLTERIGRSS